jgi:hypothetical protein
MPERPNGADRLGLRNGCQSVIVPLVSFAGCRAEKLRTMGVYVLDSLSAVVYDPS